MADEKQRKENDKTEYLDTGFRPDDGREGFGDDMGTRVGRPDGAGAKPAPLDSQGGRKPQPGQPGTNADPVSDGLEGAMTGEAASGPQQARVQDAAKGEDDGGDKAGDDRRVFDL
jgi:hypothetical protein